MVLNSTNDPCVLLKSTVIFLNIYYVNYGKNINCAKRNAERYFMLEREVWDTIK